MRVIAGKFRSRPLHSLQGLDVRPTSDRLRESLFNVLTAGNPDALDGSVWVDLFAGTGAVGIEAISRGAAMVHFVDCSRRAADLIAKNLASLKLQQGFRIMQQESAHALVELDSRNVRADYVFFDPPYSDRNAYRGTLEALAGSNLAKHALVITEHEKRFDPGERFGSLQRSRKLEQGDAALSFYRT